MNDAKNKKMRWGCTVGHKPSVVAVVAASHHHHHRCHMVALRHFGKMTRESRDGVESHRVTSRLLTNNMGYRKRKSDAVEDEVSPEEVAEMALFLTRKKSRKASETPAGASASTTTKTWKDIELEGENEVRLIYCSFGDSMFINSGMA